MSSDIDNQQPKDKSGMDLKDTTCLIWLFLCGATIIHAGSTIWALLSTAKLPPGYEVPPRWGEIFGQGPTSNSFWAYIILLGFYVIRESWHMGQKTYIPSNFFPEIKSSNVAVILWLVLWIFSHLGHAQGWFPVPEGINGTFGWCILFWITQHLMIKVIKKPDELKDNPNAEAPNPQVQATWTEATSRGSGLVVPDQRKNNPAPSPKTSLAVPISAPKQVVSSDTDLTGKLLDYVRQNGQAKTGGLVVGLGASRRTVIRNLNKLLADGRLKREGTGPGAVYRLNESRNRSKEIL